MACARRDCARRRLAAPPSIRMVRAQMMYPRVLVITALAALSGCGDNHKILPDGGMPGGDGSGSGSAATCSLDVDSSALASGTWDTRFTVPGFTGPDGHSPTVYDFARD